MREGLHALVRGKGVAHLNAASPQDKKMLLFFAVRKGRVELVEQLLAAGVDADAQDEVRVAWGGGSGRGREATRSFPCDPDAC